MIKVHEIINKRPKGGSLGLELEVEFKNPGILDQAPITSTWKAKGEGSLRFHGVEFVTQKPIRANPGKRDKIDRLVTLINDPRWGVIKDSPRTSFHVHVNVLDHTAIELANQIMAWLLFRNFLVKYFGDTK